MFRRPQFNLKPQTTLIGIRHLLFNCTGAYMSLCWAAGRTFLTTNHAMASLCKHLQQRVISNY